MCREEAWAELTVSVTFPEAAQHMPHGFLMKTVNFGWLFLFPSFPAEKIGGGGDGGFSELFTEKTQNIVDKPRKNALNCGKTEEKP